MGGAFFIPKDYFSFSFDYQKEENGYKIIELGITYSEISGKIEKVFDNKERFELAKNLAIHLAPHISISAILQKTLYYRIIKELMDERIILDRLNHELAQRFYADLRPYYDWDARYWEQRALAESHMNHLEPAMSNYTLKIKKLIGTSSENGNGGIKEH